MKKAQKPKKSSAQSSERPRRALVPQPHGGALLPGGTGAPGTGRPPSLVREKLVGSFEQRIAVLEQIADGTPMEQVEVPFISILPHVKCPKCESQMEASDPAALFMLSITGKRSARPGDRTKAIDVMAKYGLGSKDDTGANEERLRQLAHAWRTAVVDRAIQELCPADLAVALQARITALSHDLTPRQSP